MKRIEYFSAKDVNGTFEFEIENFSSPSSAKSFYSTIGGNFNLVHEIDDYPDTRYFIYYNKAVDEKILAKIKSDWFIWCPLENT